jgi:hypothetical protein
MPRDGEIAFVVQPRAVPSPFGRDLERAELVFEFLERHVAVRLAFKSEAARASFEEELTSFLLDGAGALEQAPVELRVWLLPWLDALRQSRPERSGVVWKLDVATAPKLMETTLERLLGMALGNPALE